VLSSPFGEGGGEAVRARGSRRRRPPVLRQQHEIHLAPLSAVLDAAEHDLTSGETLLEDRHEDAEKVRSRFRPPLILFMGRLRYYKGISYLLEAMRGLDASLLIAGDGPKAKEWNETSRRLGLEGRVFFLGEVSEKEKRVLYQACDVFVLPSSHRSEAFGLVLLEAMASGKPVVSTELATGTSFVNQHEKTGLVVPPRDSTALRESLARLLGNARLRGELGEQGRKRALGEFDVEKMISRIDNIYRELLVPGKCR